jgi:L,D-transpeptidase YbiS
MVVAVTPPAAQLLISIASQRLWLHEAGRVFWSCAVSTAARGAGERLGSQQTPRGRHRVRASIGTGAPLNSVFVGRRATGEIYSAELARQYPGRDWILTRILWLSGLEAGRNRGGEVDTQRRYIYIHGAPSDGVNGQPASHGCIRVASETMLTLYELVPPCSLVEITEAACHWDH